MAKKKRETKPTVKKVEVIEVDSTIEEIKLELENGVVNLRYLSNKYNKTIKEIINIKKK
tara:strand:- start:12390 stop:12566 length:177 start_codon:yes stop_codon:yes gene_type:complete